MKSYPVRLEMIPKNMEISRYVGLLGKILLSGIVFKGGDYWLNGIGPKNMQALQNGKVHHVVMKQY